MWPGMFDGLIYFVIAAVGIAFALGIVLAAGVFWVWPYLPSIRVVWP